MNLILIIGGTFILLLFGIGLIPGCDDFEDYFLVTAYAMIGLIMIGFGFL